MVEPGIYNHFKGNTYIVTGVAMHSENREKLILYYAYGDHLRATWARPERMFAEIVEWPNGEFHPRFKFVKDYDLSL